MPLELLCLDHTLRSVHASLPALTARAVVDNFMGKEITVNAEMVVAHCAFVSTADADALGLRLGL